MWDKPGVFNLWMRYSRALIERFYARRAHTWSARTDSLLRQQVNTNDLSEVLLNLFFHRASLWDHTMVQVQVWRAARMSFTYYVINTNQPDV